MGNAISTILALVNSGVIHAITAEAPQIQVDVAKFLSDVALLDKDGQKIMADLGPIIGTLKGVT